MNVREAWNILKDEGKPGHNPTFEQRKEAWAVINRFGIYGDTLKEMENGERYEAEMEAMIPEGMTPEAFAALTPEERETARGIDGLTSLPDPEKEKEYQKYLEGRTDPRD